MSQFLRIIFLMPTGQTFRGQIRTGHFIKLMGYIGDHFAKKYFRLKKTHKLQRQSLKYCRVNRDRRDQEFRDDTDIDTLWGPESRPILIPILRLSLYRDRYWYWYHEIVPGLILIPILYLIRIMPRPGERKIRPLKRLKSPYLTKFSGKHRIFIK